VASRSGRTSRKDGRGHCSGWRGPAGGGSSRREVPGGGRHAGQRGTSCPYSGHAAHDPRRGPSAPGLREDDLPLDPQGRAAGLPVPRPVPVQRGRTRGVGDTASPSAPPRPLPGGAASPGPAAQPRRRDSSGRNLLSRRGTHGDQVLRSIVAPQSRAPSGPGALRERWTERIAATATAGHRDPIRGNRWPPRRRTDGAPAPSTKSTRAPTKPVHTVLLILSPTVQAHLQTLSRIGSVLQTRRSAGSRSEVHPRAIRRLDALRIRRGTRAGRGAA
jgi:hypothetical protein